MSESSILPHLAELLRPVIKDVSSGRGKLCLSTEYLRKLNNAFDENVPEDLTSSFHLTDAKASLQRDLQFLLDLVKSTTALKVTPDLINNGECSLVNIRRFKNIKILEIHKIDIKNVIGIQRLRSQLQELICVYNLEVLGDILNKCGGDLSSPNLWSELKNANFSHNHITDIDTSLEATPWLNTLDLSYNHLTNVEFINNLPNLKYLNISYNKLEKAPKFRGQICKRLQVLLLNNNFIEDLSGISSLSNLSQLDLSQNCIMDHKSLLSISHMPSLYFLNLIGNPINFHPYHRTITCNYLNKNTSTLKLVLDNKPLTKSEKLLTGSLYPISQSSLGSSNNSSQNSLDNSIQEKQKKVRNVEIQEGYDIIVEPKKNTPVSTPKINSGHLEVKNKIEQLRQEYGESWLARHSGEIFQEVLGFDRHRILSSTPSENNPAEMYFKENITNEDKPIIVNSTGFETAQTHIIQEDTGSEKINTAQENEDSSIYKSLPNESPEESLSDDDDACDGELFFASIVPDHEDYELSIIVTESHMSERDSISSKEKARWHVNVIKSCQLGEKPNEVQIVFDTFRSDRKSRVYYMEEAEKFIEVVSQQMIKNKIPDKKIQYQCMKCNELFSRTKAGGVLVEVTVTCPKCESNLIIESK